MKRIVVIGGGTGSYTVLKGLKKYPVNLTAIVSMTDDGGSTGILRDEYGILPPGDVRRCIAALSESTEIMKELFQFRFANGGLKGHNFGNLFITALKEITGSDDKAIKEACKILAIRGKVIPVTLDNARLIAILENNQEIFGETNIDIPKHDGNLKIKKLSLVPEAKANPEAVESILKADMIIIGPGDLYSSVISNLVVSGIPEAIQKSKAKKVYTCNLMTKFGETNNFQVEDFLQEIENYLGKGVITHLIFNTAEMNPLLLEKYKEEKAFPVAYSLQKLQKKKVKLIAGNFVTEPVLIRHDSEKLAKSIMQILEPLP